MNASSVLPMMASSEYSTIAAIRREASVASFSSVTSRQIIEAPTTASLWSRMGEVVIQTGTSVPSFRTRSVSSVRQGGQR